MLSNGEYVTHVNIDENNIIIIFDINKYVIYSFVKKENRLFDSIKIFIFPII